MKDAITIVDSKSLNVEEWAGCTIFKPNAKEAEQMTGTKDWQRQCDILQDRVGCMGVVITCGANGICGKTGARHFEYRPRTQVRANSVVGGGDNYISCLSLGLCCGLDIIDVAEIAFKASSIYVQAKHNKPITPYDLLRYVDPIEAKFVSVEYLQEVAKKEDLTMVNGIFDAGLTSAHVQYLQYAKSLGDKLVVALNSDDSTSMLKPGRPIMNLNERMKIVAGNLSVDYVVSFEEETPLELIKKVMPNRLVKGPDYKPSEVAGYGIVDIVITERFDGISTTEKLEKVGRLVGKNWNEDDI